MNTEILRLECLCPFQGTPEVRISRVGGQWEEWLKQGCAVFQRKDKQWAGLLVIYSQNHRQYRKDWSHGVTLPGLLLHRVTLAQWEQWTKETKSQQRENKSGEGCGYVGKGKGGSGAHGLLEFCASVSGLHGVLIKGQLAASNPSSFNTHTASPYPRVSCHPLRPRWPCAQMALTNSSR